MPATLDDVVAESKLQTVAIQLMLRNVTYLPLAIGKNIHDAIQAAMKAPKPPSPPSSNTAKSDSGIASVLTALSGKFLAVLGPMAILAAVVSSQASGFQVLLAAVHLLAVSLAPILLPVVLVLAAALAALSDVLWAHLFPALETWDSFILGRMIPTVVALVSLFDKLTKAIEWLVSLIPGGSKKDGEKTPADSFEHGAKTGEAIRKGDAKGVVDSLGGFLKHMITPGSSLVDLNSMIDRLSGSKTTEIGPAAPEAKPVLAAGLPRGKEDDVRGIAPPRGAAGAKTPGKLVMDSLKDTMAELRLSAMPKAQFTGLAEVGKQSQLAALNASPWESKMLERMTKIIEVMEKAVGDLGDDGKPLHETK